jgi:hypothetical protein
METLIYHKKGKYNIRQWRIELIKLYVEELSDDKLHKIVAIILRSKKRK